jgi:hypothetical protein
MMPTHPSDCGTRQRTIDSDALQEEEGVGKTTRVNTLARD